MVGIRRRVLAGAAVAATTVAMAATPGTAYAAGPGHGSGRPAFTLTLMHSNDMESQLLGVDAGGAELGYGGVARFATVVDQLRRDATHGPPGPGEAAHRAALVLSSGDNYLAGPEFTASLEHGIPFYDATAMRLIGYDASAIGNHGFDFGPDTFADFVQSTKGAFPFVSANIDVSGEPRLAEFADDGTIVARTVVRKRGARIGLVGLTTPALPTITSPRNVTVSDDLVNIVRKQVAALTDSGVNKVVLVSHLQDIDNERALVHELDGVDVVVGGGGAELLANDDDRLVPGDERSINPDTGEPYSYPIVESDVDGTQVPIVTTNGDYKYVGHLRVSFDRAGNVIPGSWKSASGPVRVSGVGPDAVEPDPQVQKRVVEPVAAFLDELRNTVVADARVPLDGVQTHVRSEETNLGDLMADSLLWTGRQQAEEFGVPEPQVAIQNGGGIRNDSVIGPGEVTAFDTFSIAPFPNLVAVQSGVTRDAFKALLERFVSAAPSPEGRFGQIAGFSFTYDPSEQAQVIDEQSGEIATPGERVQEATLAGPDGEPSTGDDIPVVQGGQVVAGDPITLATNDFSARGGDAYPLGEFDFTVVGKTYQQALVDYLKGPLGGKVTSDQYAEGGGGRITATG
ncbi:MAG: bifunctional metallophosphatase/5'-nucleotidase [Streptosporangiales bacterium]